MSWDSGVERLKARLHRRAFAYRALFKTPGGNLGVQAETVLKDLARYCYVSKPTLKVSPITGTTDPIAMAFAEGRRDVFNRITALCELTDEQIQRIANAKGNDE